MITSIVDLVSVIKVWVYYAFGNILSRGRGGSICNFPLLLDKSVQLMRERSNSMHIPDFPPKDWQGGTAVLFSGDLLL